MVSTTESMILVTTGKIKTTFLFLMTKSPGSLPKGNLGKSKKIVPMSAIKTPKIIKKRAILCMPFYYSDTPISRHSSTLLFFWWFRLVWYFLQVFLLLFFLLGQV